MRSLAESSQVASGSARLLVTIPALDEARTVADVIERIPREIEGVGSVEVLVVDDGSVDGTGDAARSAGARVERHETTRGVGAAFCTALRYGVQSGADLIVSIDADGQFDPADIPELIRPVVEGRADFTTASRFKDRSLAPLDMPPIKRWGNEVVARIISSLARQRIHDVSCGMRCYGRRAALELNPMASFTYTQEILLNLAFKNLRIVEVPIRVRGEREHGESRVARSVLRYGIRTTAIILRCYRDYRPMALFGTMAAAVGGVGLLLTGFLLIHYLSSGQLSPHKWAGFGGGAFLAVSLLLFFVGLIGDMLNRHRIYLEELLYESRRRSGPEDPR
jgi:glycosyltransferase involved in cell wall biosynthesis